MFSKARACVLIVFFCSQIVLLLGDFTQQRAKVLHNNPKYIGSAAVFTTRHGRHSPYVTDCNVTIFQSWGNNVTLIALLVPEITSCDRQTDGLSDVITFGLHPNSGVYARYCIPVWRVRQLVKRLGHEIRTMYYKHKAKSEALVLEVKTCDMLKLKWVRDWVQKYSNISADACPLKIGSYRITGFEVPPKNFPIPMGSGDYENLFTVYLTKTKEIILEIIMDLKFENKLKKT